MNFIYKCPVCSGSLKKADKAFVCEKNHSYDIASQGYVNLLLANQKKTKAPGDDKGMVECRTSFLERGYYDCLSNELNEIIFRSVKESPANVYSNILDLGCGEGFYSEKLLHFLEKKNSKRQSRLWGVDVSRSAIQRAAKRSPALRFCVGNNYQLPYLDESVDLVFSVFSPLDPKELLRVLRPKGFIIIVRPGASHLKELAELLYDRFERQGDSSALPEQLDRPPLKILRITYPIHLKKQEDIANLIGMTSYYWSLTEEEKELLAKKRTLTVTADFQGSVFQK